MGLVSTPETTFDNVFNLMTEDVQLLDIKENYNQDKCLIWNRQNPHICYSTFILDENSKTKILCDVTFYRSSKTGKYLPRLTFKKTDKDFNEREVAHTKPINISFNDSKKSIVFWKFIGFLYQYKELVDLGEFEESYKVAPKEAFYIEFESKSDKEKLEALKELVQKTDLTEHDVRSIVFENRKKNLKAFLYLLKDLPYKGDNSIGLYQRLYNLKGEEAVWHHFLKKNDWILGLNVDIKFIREFYDEQKIGSEDSKGRNSPQSDLLGISNYTTLIELKHSSTRIFKKSKSNKSRANTWDFSSDFIEGISQCLAQKTSLERSYDTKEFVNESKQRLNKIKHKTVDPKTVFIIGNRQTEFPHDSSDENHVKSETFERFRRNNRNVEVVTFDELFERAYHVVFSEKIPENWFEDDEIKIEN